jgi:hypothetical protein
MGEWRYSSTVLDFDTRWVVSFAPWPLYPRVKSPRYLLDMRLGGPQRRSGRCEENKNILPLLKMEPRFLGLPVHSLVAILTSHFSCLIENFLRLLRKIHCRVLKIRSQMNPIRTLAPYTWSTLIVSTRIGLEASCSRITCYLIRFKFSLIRINIRELGAL